MNDNDDGRAVMPEVVQALMRKRVNAGALVTAGRKKSRFQIDGWSIRLRFDCQILFAVARIRSVRETGKAECQPFVWARFVKRGRHRTL